MRVIAYVAAARLAILWHKLLQGVLTKSVNLKQDVRTLSYLFPPSTVDVIRGISDSGALCFKHAGRGHSAANTFPATPRKLSNERLPSPAVLDSILTTPFLDLYRNKELRTRELVLKHGRHVFDMPEYRELLDRLTIGFTLPEVRLKVAHLDNVIRVDKLVSLFLDRSIDRGVVVPITAARNGLVHRAYRHGEDVEFGETEEHLCVHALDKLRHASKRDGLPRTWVEKVLVLLIRIGLEQQFFNAWDQTMGDHETVGIRYSLHGAVSAIGAPTLYVAQDYFGVPDLMREHGYIEATESAGFWRIINVPTNGVHPERAEKARLVGSVMGRVLGEADPIVQVKDDELIILATCLYPRDIAGALAAEIAIISRLWFYLRDEFKSRPISEIDVLEASRMSGKLRHSAAFTAANSGTWKFVNFWQATGWKIIQRVSANLPDPIHQSAWNGLWPQEGRHIGRMMSDELRSLIEREGEWLHRLKALQMMIDMALRLRGGVTPKKVRQGKQAAADQKAREVFAAEIKASILTIKAAAVAAGKKTRNTELLTKAARRLEGAVAKGPVEIDHVYEFATTQLKHALRRSPELTHLRSPEMTQAF